MYDLIVVGGGPAGTSAAITAARGGARVLLLERGKFPRQKVCGEFVSAESLALLSRLLNPENASVLQDAIRVSRGRFFVEGRVLDAAIQPAAASIARLDLDLALWNSALSCGVETRQQTMVRKIEGQGPFVVATDTGEIEARAVVDATGRWSNLSAARLGNGRSLDKEKWLGVKGHFREAGPSVSVDLYFSDAGYCGVQPIQMRGCAPAINVCAMVRADVASDLPEVFNLHPELKTRSRNWRPISLPVSTSPLIFHKPQPLDRNVLLVGDAAAFVDPFIGDGISLALRGGALASECLAPFFRGGLLGTAVSQYQQAYGKRLARIYWTSSRVRQMLRCPRPIRKAAVFLFDLSPALTQYFVRKTR